MRLTIIFPPTNTFKTGRDPAKNIRKLVRSWRSGPSSRVMHLMFPRTIYGRRFRTEARNRVRPKPQSRIITNYAPENKIITLH